MKHRNEVVEQRTKTLPESRKREPDLRPPVDIFEDSTGLTLHADMPGVSKKELKIHIDHDTLTIEGEAKIPTAEGLTPLFAELRSTNFRRSFTLSRELDGEKVDATLHDGVLTLRIPKREEHKPRRIEVRTA